MTQGQLADNICVNANTISNYEKGNSTPDFAILEKLIKILDIDAHAMLYEDLTESGKNILLTKTPKNAMLSNHGEKHGIKHDIRKLQKTPCFATYPASHESPEMNVADVVPLHRFSLRTDHVVEEQRVPLYDLDASAGFVSLFLDDHQLTPSSYITLPDLPPCDGAIHVCGDSMYPLLKSGDIVLYKQTSDIPNGILWGEMYLVSMQIGGEEQIVVKYIQRGSDDTHVRLASYNTHYSPMDVPLTNIRSLALIKASVRYNTMG